MTTKLVLTREEIEKAVKEFVNQTMAQLPLSAQEVEWYGAQPDVEIEITMGPSF